MTAPHLTSVPDPILEAAKRDGPTLDDPTFAGTKCGAKKKGGPGSGHCTQPAGWGTRHPGAGRCKLHGGASPNGEKNGARKLAEKKASESIERLTDIEVAAIQNPLAAFTTLAAEAVALKDHFANVVATLEDYGSQSFMAGEQLDVRVALYERAMDRCGTFLVDWARLNIDERLVKVEEAKVELVATALERTLVDIGIDSNPDVRAVLGRHLRALEAPAA